MWLSGPDGGVCVLGEITSAAEQSADEPDPYWTDPADSGAVNWHVGIRLGQPLPELIPRTVLAARTRTSPTLRSSGCRAAVTPSRSPTASGTPSPRALAA